MDLNRLEIMNNSVIHDVISIEFYPSTICKRLIEQGIGSVPLRLLTVGHHLKRGPLTEEGLSVYRYHSEKFIEYQYVNHQLKLSVYTSGFQPECCKFII